MEKIIYTKDEWNESFGLLKKYYGIDNLTTEAFLSLRSIEDDSNNISKLRNLYLTSIGECENDKMILNALNLLSYYFDREKSGKGKETIDSSVQKSRRQDLLRLYIFCYNSMNYHENINVSSRVDAIKLNNSDNWLWKDIYKDYFKNNIPDITSIKQAQDELIKGKSKRGRRPKDEKLLAIIWGTYQLLTDLHGFKSAMPNSLCDFIVRYSQLLGVVPENTDVDKYWVRAELRYIKLNRKAISFQ